jgi:azurin
MIRFMGGMRGFCWAIGALFGGATLGFAEPPEWSAKPDVAIVIKTTEGTMRYDLPEFTVTPGARVRLTLDNEDQLQHNLVLLKTEGGAAAGLQFAQTIWAEGEPALARGWMPADQGSVLAASRLMDPKSKQDLYFIAPEKAGSYPFVCTVPGHATIMNGLMRVRTTSPTFTELRYTLYEGKWDNLPEFSTLKPIESGPVPGGLITLDVIGARKPDNFALVFEGSFEVPVDDEYEFLLGSDDGSRLIIDGEGELEVNGIHPFTARRKKLAMTKGLHSLTLQYFEAGGGQELALAAKRKKGGLLKLSEEAPASLINPTPPNPVIPLRPVEAGEAVLYRNFIQGSSPRGIAVGYPGGVNVCWDADVCNLSMIWRGAFMDAGRHWTGRGTGSQPPMGFDVASPALGYPLQVLSTPEDAWKPFSKVAIRFEKDVAEPVKEIMVKVPHADYRFRGYRLDAKRFPELSYDFRKLKVTERFAPAPSVNGLEALDRVITITGEAEPSTMFRLATGAGPADESGWYPIGPVTFRVDGGEPPLTRPGQGGNEVLLPIRGAATIKLQYRWTAAIGGKAPAAN